MRKASRVLIADDHALFRQGIHALLRDNPDLHVVGEAASETELIEKSRLLHPDVVLVDADLPSVDGLQATRLVREALPETKVIVLSIKDDYPELVYAAIKAGALGFVTKTSEIGELIGAIRAVSNGQASIATRSLTSLVTVLGNAELDRSREESLEETLTEREEEVLELVTQGHSNREIASVLCISESTVRSHLHNILDKLHLNNRVQAATYALTSKRKQRARSSGNGRGMMPAGVGSNGLSSSSSTGGYSRNGKGTVDHGRAGPAVLPRYQPTAAARVQRVPEAS